MAPTSPIPAINGTCPDGYAYDPSSDQCFLISPPISLTSTGVALPDVDPKNAAELAGLGTQNSGLPERLALAIWWALLKLGNSPLKDCGVALPAAIDYITRWIAGRAQAMLAMYDYLVCFGVDFYGTSATRNNPGLWALVGGLLSDLLGVHVDGSAIYRDMQNRGTIPAMRDTGAALVNLFVGEFTGTASGAGGQVSFSSNVNPATGLPAATLTPAGGIQAAQTLMGFVLSSAVRQGNLDAVASTVESIPVVGGFMSGHVEKYSEAMRANLGIGRMLRFALRPIFQDLIATPLKWAMNIEYRLSMFNVAESARALLSGAYTQADFLAEAARAGYTDARANILLGQHSVLVGVKELLTLRAAGQMSDAVVDGWLGRHGYDAASKDWTRTASDLDPARKVALALAEHYLLEYGKGNITTAALHGFIDGLRTAGFMLTPGEVTALENTAALIANVKGIRVRHLSLGELKKAYIDGTITLQEYGAHATELGFIDTDVQILEIDLLVDAKKAAEAAAAKAAAAAARAAKAAAKGGTTSTAPTTGG